MKERPFMITKKLPCVHRMEWLDDFPTFVLHNIKLLSSKLYLFLTNDFVIANNFKIFLRENFSTV